MSSPKLSVVPVVESTSSFTFHHGHSSPGLSPLDGLPSQNATLYTLHRNTAVPTSTVLLPSSLLVTAKPIHTSTTPFSPSSADSSFKSLPSLSTFNVALSDFDIDADFEVESLQPESKKPAQENMPGCSGHGGASQLASETESLTTRGTSNHSSPIPQPTTHDPLWVAFKDLEANFFKFLSKATTPDRITLIRAALVPFLRCYALHSSNKDTDLLSAKDIENRASIFNRWWYALLEMLDSSGKRSGELGHSSLLELISSGSTYFPTSAMASTAFAPLSGIDHAVVLEALSMIMSRPEWRLLTNVFRPLIDRSPGECVRARARARANTDDASLLEDSDIFVEELAEYNVRNMFVSNLLAQLVLVVDRMTMRHAPLSTVNFAGKACAYAFFFVPGVADILVRLWGLDKNICLIRRTADAFGLLRRCHRDGREDPIALFPPGMGSLGWSSVRTMHAELRKAPKTSLLGSRIMIAWNRIPWFSPRWLARWQGSESDLLFVFCKHYHLLAGEFMPPILKLPLVEKARAPAYVLLHAQLLHILDNTIHRQAAVEAAMMAAPMADKPFWAEQQAREQTPGVDLSPSTSAPDIFPPPALLQPGHDFFHRTDGNRVISLLRDFLTADVSLSGARETFSESVMILLKAAAMRTSRYNNNACYILCDFLHEVLMAFDRYCGFARADQCKGYSQSVFAPVDFVDWSFWLDVCKMMLSSDNTKTEIRVLSFIFSTWDIITADSGRKEALCIHWLLAEDIFDRMFNNWCPMVRTYYMRLLCWRMCWDIGRPSGLDAEIFIIVSERLQKVWSHYLWLKQKADREGQLPPSTVPSLPRPGKQFMIVPIEVNVPQLDLLAGNRGTSNVATTFDASLIPFGGSAGTFEDHLVPPASTDNKTTDGSSARKKRSILSRALKLTASPSSGSPTGQLSNDAPLGQIRQDTAASRLSAPLPSTGTARPGLPSGSGPSSGSMAAFESSQFIFKFVLHNIPWKSVQGSPGGTILPPSSRKRTLTCPVLPELAQARVSTRLSSAHRLSESTPPPAVELAAASRRVLGAATGGLVNKARNAYYSDSLGPDLERGKGLDIYSRDGSPAPEPDCNQQQKRSSVQPTEPKDRVTFLRAKYAGRALAEWDLVINECNSFVDHQRDEGVFGLNEIEVPSLGVESM